MEKIQKQLSEQKREIIVFRCFCFGFLGGGGLMFAIYPDTMMGRRLVAPAITATFLSIPSNQAVSLICSANH